MNRNMEEFIAVAVAWWVVKLFGVHIRMPSDAFAFAERLRAASADEFEKEGDVYMSADRSPSGALRSASSGMRELVFPTARMWVNGDGVKVYWRSEWVRLCGEPRYRIICARADHAWLDVYDGHDVAEALRIRRDAKTALDESGGDGEVISWLDGNNWTGAET